MSKLSENALPGITTDVGLPHLAHSVAEIMRLASAGQSCFSIQSTSPWFQTGSALVPDTLPVEPCKQILITLVAAHGGDRHILLLGQPIFQLRSPTPPPHALSEQRTGGPASHRVGSAHIQSSTLEERHWPQWPSLASCRLLPQTPLSLSTEADTAAPASGTGSPRLLKATALQFMRNGSQTFP